MQELNVFTREQLKTIFPFHVMVGEDMQLIQVGDLIKKLINQLELGTSLFTYFEIKNARKALKFSDIVDAADKLYYLNALCGNLTLKGAFYPTAKSSQLIYIGNMLPIQILSNVGTQVNLKDFPIYDSFPDFLFIQRANERTIQELKLSNQKIFANRSFTEKIFSSMIDVVVVLNPNYEIIRLNDSFYKIMKYSKEELIGQSFEVLLSRASKRKIKTCLQRIKEDSFINLEIDLIDAYRKNISFSISLSAIIDSTGEAEAILCVAQDITLRKKIEEEKTKSIKAAVEAENAIKQSEKLKKINDELIMSRNEIKKSLDEKDILLREIHHRVKNNMQVITSMLSLQSSYIEDAKILDVFKVSQQRINSMALIHDMLYHTDDFTKVNYTEYLNELFKSTVASFFYDQNLVQFEINVAQKYLNLDTAIPLGLLINEILTNSFKYGVKNESKGLVYIQIEALEYPNFILKMGDNGKGIPAKHNYKTSNSLGIKLIHKLTAQLQGKVSFDTTRGKGTHYKIQFQEITNVF